ncbi:HET-domain-containing protein [Whalleya microplaca]|nr:HET-domain-containing protein [Whalleya microplaca]
MPDPMDWVRRDPEYHWKKSHPPSSQVPLCQQKDIVEYFSQRQQAHDQSTPRTYSVAKPHTCKICEAKVIDGDIFETSSPYPQIEPWPWVALCSSLQELICSAQFGCAFLEWIVDRLAESKTSEDVFFLGEECAEITFHLQLQPSMRNRLVTYFFIEVELIRLNGESKTASLKSSCMTIWTTKENGIASYIPERPIECDKTSTVSTQFCRESLRDCIEKHPGCRLATNGTSTPISIHESIASEHLPTRLLRIQDGGNFVLLVVLDNLSDSETASISDHGYASLSYCWGGGQSVYLTHDTFPQLTQGVSSKLLPRTMQDAVWVVNMLGLEWLWIDALCILQDDDLDKELEIARMALYYSCNTVTISAACAKTCRDGFLASADQEIKFRAGPFQLGVATRWGNGTVQLLQKASRPPAEPIAARCWTYQETLLSRRLLSFCKDQVYWSCKMGEVGCGGIEAKDSPGYRTTHTNIFATHRTLGSVSSSPWEHVWKYVVEEFMLRSLSVESDKLLAIAALASKMKDLAVQQKSSVTYLVGLFINTNSDLSWAGNLLWYVDAKQSCRPCAYRAPSWSWASLDGPYSSFDDHRLSTHDLKESNIEFKVLEFDVTLAHSEALYGRVNSTRLIVSGWARYLSDNLKMKVIYPKFKERFPRKYDITETTLLLYGDTTDDLMLIQGAIKEGTAQCAIWLLELVRPDPRKDYPWAGLILREGKDRIMSRVGVFVVRGENMYGGKNKECREIMDTFFDVMLKCQIN